MAGRSFVTRLTSAYAATMAAILLAFGGATYWGLATVLTQQLDDGLLATARKEVAYATDPHPGEGLHLHESANLASSSGLHHHVQITDLEGHIVVANQELKTHPLPLEATALAGNRQGQIAFRSFEFVALPHRMLYYPLRYEGRTYSLQVAVSREYLQEVERRLLQLFAALGLLALAGSTLVGRGLARRAIWPVRRITDTAAAISGANLSQRLPVGEADDELARLSHVLNGMLDRLEQALESQRRFTSDAAHELRSPLTILKTNLDLALRRPREAAEYHEVMRSNLEEVERLIALTNDLLVLARSDVGGLALRRAPVELDELVAETVRRHAAEAERRGVQLDLALGLAQTRVALDRDRIVQLLDNLLSNALRYTPADKRVTVTTRAEGGEVRLEVADEGIGIPADEQDKVFERFYRSDKARSREAGGTGLGLSISRLIAEGHGGRITLTSEPGQGSRFTVRLPLNDDHA